MFYNDEQVLVTWMTDSSNVESIHRNAPNLSAVDSYLGTVEARDGTWGYFLKGEEFVPCINYATARKGLELAAIAILPPEDSRLK